MSKKNAIEILHKLESEFTQLEREWKNSFGWAPDDIAYILESARFDWNVSLVKVLIEILSKINQKEAGTLIISYTILGTLLENTMKIFLIIYKRTYQNSNDVSKNKNKLTEPIDLKFDDLKKFIIKNVLIFHLLESPLGTKVEFTNWLTKIQRRRNAIHALKNREIGSINEFYTDIVKAYNFFSELSNQLPSKD
jgi:hypothetical protein